MPKLSKFRQKLLLKEQKRAYLWHKKGYPMVWIGEKMGRNAVWVWRAVKAVKNLSTDGLRNKRD